MSQKTEGISFNKVIPVRRTSEQSVLSSLSLKSNLASKTHRTPMKCKNHANSMGSSQVSLRPHQQRTSATSLQNSNIGVKMPFTSGGDTLGGGAPNNGKNSQDVADDVYETDDNDSEDENHKANDLTQQALRKLSFLKINNDNTPSSVSNSDSSKQLQSGTPTPVASEEHLVQSPGAKQPLTTTTTLPSSRSNSTSASGGIKQVSSFLNTTTAATTNQSSSSSSSSISSTDTFKNRKQAVHVRQLHLQQQQQQQQQQLAQQHHHLLSQGKNGLPRASNGQRSIMKPSSSSSILFSKSNTSAQTPPPPSLSTLSQQGIPTSSSSHMLNNQTRNVPTQFIKQINNPKRPMYTPAVLRNVSETNLTNDDYIHIPQSIPESLSLSMSPSSSSYILNNNKRDSINNMSRSMDLPLSNYSRQQIPIPVRSLTPMTHLHLNSNKSIRTSHWVPDSMRDNCKKCHIQFSLWERKHHCRHCGEIFCHRDLQRKLFLNSDAQFIEQTYLGKKFLSKVCDLCYNQYHQFIIDSQNGTDTLNQSSQPRQLIINQQSQDHSNGSNRNRKRKDSIAGSVPVDWNWSSF